MTENDILAAIDGLSPALQRAYLDQVRSIVDAAVIADVAQKIEDGDDHGLLLLVGLGSLIAFIEALRTTYIKGGSTPKEKPPGGKRVQFDQHQPEAQQWLTQNAQRTVEQLQAESAEAVRATVAAGRTAGQSAYQTALDIVGRTSKQTGKRVGGVIGIPGADALTIINAKKQLLSGDAEELRNYLRRVDREKAMDGIVTKAIEAKKPIAAPDAQRMVAAYADKKLKNHALLVAHRNALEAYNAGFHRFYEQLMSQATRPLLIEKLWRNKGDMKVRHAHVLLGGQRITMGQLFQSETGAALMYPGDSAHGAEWADLARCRCTVSYRVTW
ncbi:hypothetical protein [Pseudomonas sp. LS-2]|uniref:hypothetical protein n=1 Tax=Pseudomonas sp. LS-2 TaxID=2315859 RepID=UPI000E70DE16|nr:hypothetical protein [Pseudomonas sp. LS-2]RJX83491.1 hypothetical protein D3M70_00240 [Pseudomonas sp. LS-2]